MNPEIIKAMNRKNEKRHICDWWHKNGYKVMRVVLFPVWGYAWARGKIKNKLNARTEWSNERANEILNYYVPRNADWDEETKSLYFFDNGYGWSMCHAKKHLKLKDRRFWNKFSGWRIRDYLVNQFELEGFTKKLGDCSCGWTEICFNMNEGQVE